jgi:[ribosomal protein S5]-alanine N-acetyltransferase
MLLLFSDAVKEGPREDEFGSPCRRRHALTRSSADVIHVPSELKEILAMPEQLAVGTPRLELVPCSLAVANALSDDVEEGGRLLDAQVPKEWPDPELAEFLPFYAKLLRKDPGLLGYGVWLIIEREARTIVGSAGFQGHPNTDGEVEIGYGVHADFRNRGYATEAARALVEWAFEQPGVKRVTAHCDRDNIPSHRVVEKAGLTQRGLQPDGRIRFETS